MEQGIALDSAYERERVKNIERNRLLLEQLGLLPDQRVKFNWEHLDLVLFWQKFSVLLPVIGPKKKDPENPFSKATSKYHRFPNYNSKYKQQQ